MGTVVGQALDRVMIFNQLRYLLFYEEKPRHHLRCFETRLTCTVLKSISSGRDSYLELLTLAYRAGDSSVAGIVLIDSKKENIQDLEDGEYESKSDLFVDYSEEKDGYIDGSTLDCAVKIAR